MSKRIYVKVNYQILESEPPDFNKLFVTPLEVNGQKIGFTSKAGIYFDPSEWPNKDLHGPRDGYDYTLASVAGVTYTKPADVRAEVQITETRRAWLWFEQWVDDDFTIPEDKLISVRPAPTAESVRAHPISENGTWSFDLRGATSSSISSLTTEAIRHGVEEVSEFALKKLVPATFADTLLKAGSLAYTLHSVHQSAFTTLNDLVTNFDTYSASEAEQKVDQLFFDVYREAVGELQSQLGSVEVNGRALPGDFHEAALSGMGEGISITVQHFKPGDSQSGWEIEVREAASAVARPNSPVVVLGSHRGAILIGGDHDDILMGGDGNDRLDPGGGDDRVGGGGGIDTAVYDGAKSNYVVRGTLAGIEIQGGGVGQDNLSHVERLEFGDKKVAFDLNDWQSAGQTVKIIGAAFGASAVHDQPDYVGVGLSLFDSGMSMADVCQLASQVMGRSNVDFVKTVYENLVGSPPSAAELDFYAGLLQGSGGTMAQSELLMLAAKSPLNDESIGMIGLSVTGVEFL